MADPWIKMRTGLHEHPKVVRIAYASDAYGRTHGVRVGCVVGLLHRTWSLADAATVDGKLDGYTPAALDAVIGVEGWCAALESVGWLTVTPCGITLCNYEVHNGATAKRRSQEADRQRAVRKQSVRVYASDADAERTRSLSLSISPSTSLSPISGGEDERGNIPPHVDDEAPRERRDALGKVLAEAEFAGAPATTLATVRIEAERWRDYRREAKLAAWTATTWRTAIRGALASPSAFSASVGQSIANGWQGLFPPRTTAAGGGPQAAQQRRAAKAASEWEEPDLASAVRQMTTKIGDRNE